ncbi:MAG: hypothetical protein KA403_05710 [Candidatus Omnitrophica bacterium]|nr:hypothetical protein [Candidatus Omnitrophota bacterium]
MNQFFANMTPLRRILFYTAVFFVIALLFDWLLIGPTVAKRAKLDDSIAQEKESIKGDIKMLSYKGKIAKEKEVLSTYFTNDLPKEEDVMADFLGKLDSFVKETGLSVQKNNRSADPAEEAKDGKAPDYLVYKADLECSGNIEDIAKLIYRIDTSKEFLKILKINLAMKKNGEVEEMRAVMTVAKYIVPSDKTLLASKATPAPEAAAR